LGDCLVNPHPLTYEEVKVIVCRKCGIELVACENWYVSQVKISNYICISCMGINAQQYYRKHREKEKAHSRQYYKKHIEEVNARNRRWRKEHPDYDREYSRRRYQNDIQYRLASNLRTRLYHAIENEQKPGSAVRDLGCSIATLKTYLEVQFEPDMSWNNYGEWHIDHIRPLSSFDLVDREQFLVACHYTNLQPLWAEDNLSKGINV